MPTPEQYTRLLEQIHAAAERKASSLIAHHLDGLSRHIHEFRRNGYAREFQEVEDLMGRFRDVLGVALRTAYAHEVAEELIARALAEVSPGKSQPELFQQPEPVGEAEAVTS